MKKIKTRKNTKKEKNVEKNFKNEENIKNFDVKKSQKRRKSQNITTLFRRISNYFKSSFHERMSNRTTLLKNASTRFISFNQHIQKWFINFFRKSWKFIKYSSWMFNWFEQQWTLWFFFETKNWMICTHHVWNELLCEIKKIA